MTSFGFIPVLLILTLTSTNSVENYPKMDTFLTSLLSSNFHKCSIILTSLQNKPNTKENTAENVLASSALNYQVSFVLEINDEFEASIAKKFEDNWDVHQHRDSCTVGIFILPDFNVEVGNRIYRISRKWSNSLKKDEDFFIFLAPGGREIEQELLVKSEIAQGIKFKILIQSDATGFKVRTSCLYCGEGRPSAIPVDWGQLITAKTALKPSENQNTEKSELKSSENGQNTAEIPFENSPTLFEFSETSKMFPDFALNFYGKNFKVGTPTGTRWLNEIHLENGKWVAKRGIYKIVMDNLMERYNFSCTFFPSKGGGGTGSQLKNGSWLGSVGNIVDGTSEIGHVTGQTWSRNKYVGYTYPVSYEMLTFTTGQPRPFYSWKAIFWPLSRDFWIGFIISFILANATLYLVIKYSKEEFSLQNIISYTLASVLEQDVPSAEKLKGTSLRIFVCFWLFFTLVVSTAYRSKLVSLMSFPNVEEPPKTFEELANSNYDFALQYLRGAAYALLRTSPNPTYKSIFKRMDLESDDVKCFQRVIEGSRFVCISWSRIADFVFARNLTDKHGQVPVVKAPDFTCFLSVGIIMPKRSVILNSFNRLIIQSTDSGHLEKWWEEDMQFVYDQRRKWEKSVGIITNYSVEESDALTIAHFMGSFYLLTTGVIFALIAFIWEKIKFRRSKNKVKEWNKSPKRTKWSGISGIRQF